jgi:Flp pilus assembly pilin Flp
MFRACRNGFSKFAICRENAAQGMVEYLLLVALVVLVVIALFSRVTHWLSGH